MKIPMVIVLCLLLLIAAKNNYASDAVEAEMLDELKITYLKDLDLEIIQQALQAAAEQQLTALTGTTDLGSLINDLSDLEDREWSPDNWRDALIGLSGGNEERYQELLTSYQEEHPTLSASEASNGMSSAYSSDYQQQVQTNQAASTQASYAFNDTNKHLENIKEISDEINKSIDSKHIQDLNARLNTEIAYLQVEVIKGLSVINQQLAQQQATNIADRTAAAKFNKIPE